MPLLPPCPDNNGECLGTFILHKYHTAWRRRNKCSLIKFCFSISWKEQKESVSLRFSPINTILNGRPKIRHIHWKTCANSFLIFLFIILNFSFCKYTKKKLIQNVKMGIFFYKLKTMPFRTRRKFWLKASEKKVCGVLGHFDKLSVRKRWWKRFF